MAIKLKETYIHTDMQTDSRHADEQTSKVVLSAAFCSKKLSAAFNSEIEARTENLKKKLNFYLIKMKLYYIQKI